MKKFPCSRATLLKAAALALALVAAPMPALAACGDSVVDAGEDCDDGNLDPGDCCSAACLWEDNGSPCDDPGACFAEGACDDGECVGTVAETCDDGDPCTTDYCDPDAGGCLARAIDGCCTTDEECDDRILCNGAETCVVSPFAPTGSCHAGVPTGCDDGDACTTDVCVPSRRGCQYTPDEDNVGCVAEDADGDGVWDRLDFCTDTPFGVAVDDEGCAAGDHAENSRRMIAESDSALEKLERTFFAPDDMKKERTLLTKIRRTIEQAAYTFRSARSCSAAKRFAKAVKLKEKVLISLDLRRRAAYIRPEAPVAPAQPGVGSDTTPADMLAAYFEIASARVEAASARFVRSSVAVDEACRTHVREKSEGTVASVDEQRGRLVLTDGRIVRAAGAVMRGTPTPGTVILFGGERFGGSDILGGTVVTRVPRPELTPYDITQCYALMVAPAQPEADLGTSPILHPFTGYRAEGAAATSTVWLERGMALYVKQNCTPPGTTPDPSGNYTRYLASLSFKTKAPFSSKTVYASAWLYGSGKWMKIGGDLSGPGTLTVEWSEEACNAANTPECGNRRLARKVVYQINVNKPGGLCRAEYEETEFELADRDPDAEGAGLFDSLMDDFVEARVIGTSGLHTALGGTRSFTASAYKVIDPMTTSYPVLETVGQGEAFAIFAARDPFWNEPGDQGVDGPAGVSFPSVQGTRNGAPYRYLCAVPDLVRDRIDECPGEPNSYFRLPWEYETGNVKCGQGNNSQWTHCGENYPYECAGKFAFDFSIPEGRPILAARGGTVLATRDNAKNSCFDHSKTICTEEQFFCCVESSGGGICTKGDPAKAGDVCGADSECDSSAGGDGQCRCAANVVAIEHDDESVGIYVHMQENGVDVLPGDRVLRGDEIGTTGNTGCSTGPHLHLQTVGTIGVGTQWEQASRLMRFQTAAGGTCVTPTSPNLYRSNNSVWFAF